MPTIADIAAALDAIAPPALAEEWDNVGLLVGDRAAEARRVMTCLTVTPDSAAEAIESEADLIVAHHPLPFRPTKRLTTDAVEGRLLWQLARGGVAIYSAHTAFDSAARGVNQRLAEGFGLTNIRPLIPSADEPSLGTGRIADAPAETTLARLVAAGKSFLKLEALRVVGSAEQLLGRVAFACGSGGSMLDDALAADCDAFVTGEASFHTCLAAESHGVGLVLLGHYASERFAVEALAGELSAAFPQVEIWPSEREHDPLRTA